MRLAEKLIDRVLREGDAEGSVYTIKAFGGSEKRPLLFQVEFLNGYWTLYSRTYTGNAPPTRLGVFSSFNSAMKRVKLEVGTYGSIGKIEKR